MISGKSRDRGQAPGRREALRWFASLAAVALTRTRRAPTGDGGQSDASLVPGRAGHDPCLDAGAPRGRKKELT